MIFCTTDTETKSNEITTFHQPFLFHFPGMFMTFLLIDGFRFKCKTCLKWNWNNFPSCHVRLTSFATPLKCKTSAPTTTRGTAGWLFMWQTDKQTNRQGGFSSGPGRKQSILKCSVWPRNYFGWIFFQENFRWWCLPTPRCRDWTL